MPTTKRPTIPPCKADEPYCVAVRLLDGNVELRDTKQGPDGPVLTFTPEEWSAFLDAANEGELDHDQLSSDDWTVCDQYVLPSGPRVNDVVELDHATGLAPGA